MTVLGRKLDPTTAWCVTDLGPTNQEKNRSFVAETNPKIVVQSCAGQ